MTDLASIAEKLAKVVRMFGSDNPNLRAEAWKALVRTLNTFGADFNDLGDRIEHAGNGALSEAEMQEIYDAGIKEGERRAAYIQRSQNQARTTHHGVFQLQFPSARDMAAFCYQRIDDLNDWETEFVTNMVSWVRTRPLSLKQQAHLEKIYLKLGGEVQ
ncbi:MAG TPA: hypothetical protein VM910_10875 [Bradyrhizobium sp.]|nr:hypothetical protein [Bradyrhizobium sp.]